MRCLLFLFVLLLPVAVRAELANDVARCAVIEGDLDRLGCFDSLAKSLGLSGPQPVPVPQSEGGGKWVVSKDTNPIDDSERVILALEADAGSGSFGQGITLVARCQSGMTEVFVQWHDYLGSDSGDIYSDWKRVTVRIGSDKATSEKWGVSTDGTATFAPKWAGELLRKMAATDKLILQTTPYSSKPITAVFDTRGLANAITPLTQACGWSLAK
jgi:type VI secretion system protein VasI